MAPPKKKIDPGSFFLCRIVGNDLVPRHRKGQTRDNMAFILENEPSLEGCEKFWIVNRIVDDGERTAITDLLDRWGQNYISVPFVLSEYAKAQPDYSRVPAGFDKSSEMIRLSPRQRLLAQTAVRSHKINAAINQNEARNAALKIGRQHARWVLPWDGGCFLTSRAWSEIRNIVLKRERLPYFIVPMARIANNDDVLQESFRPETPEEPQIIFRNDARETFNERFYYGHREKIEMLWRLGVPGAWDGWAQSPLHLPRPKLCGDAGKFAAAGWVARLSAGHDIASAAASLSREDARAQALITFIDNLDELARMAGAST